MTRRESEQEDLPRKKVRIQDPSLADVREFEKDAPIIDENEEEDPDLEGRCNCGTAFHKLKSQ